MDKSIKDMRGRFEITGRVRRLREVSQQSLERISGERAELITDFYSSGNASLLSAPVLRAKAFYHLLAKKRLYIGDGELIVGERGPEPKAVSTYPELSLHSPDDLDILASRPKVSFEVDDEVRRLYSEKIIPYWSGKTNRDRIMGLMSDEWHNAYRAGVFTEFQEQRAPGHTVIGANMFRKGFLNLKDEIEQAERRLDFGNDEAAFDKLEQYSAMKIACDAIVMYAERYAYALEEAANGCRDKKRREELRKMAAICHRVPAHAPETMHEALQHYWFIHVGVISELNPWDSFSPGRLDQHLLPLFLNDIEKGLLTEAEAYELLCCLWVKFNNHPAPPKIGVTASESSTYTDFTLINLGGLTPDGDDAVNRLSYIILDVIEEMRLLQPGSMVQISSRTPKPFLHRALEIVKSGFGQPSFFNSDAIVKELLRQGKSITDARNGGASGCVETGAFGAEAYWLTGYFNLPKILELTLNNGFDRRTGMQVGPETGRVSQINSIDDLLAVFAEQVNYFASLKLSGNNIVEGTFSAFLPVPFLSLLIDDCIVNGTDYNRGGARYNSSYIQGVGLGTVTDMLTSICYNLFDNKHYTWSEMLEALESDFSGFEEMQYNLIYNTPRYGNDNFYADRFASKTFRTFFDAVDGRKTLRGGTSRINMLPTTCHVYFGSVLGATPDGRREGAPVSEGISPVQGADIEGPTAVLRSALSIDHLLTGGTLLNQKFSPSFFASEESIGKLGDLIRTYFSMDGHHIQFNVVDGDTLRRARANPEQYRDLIVRVAGYSDYFRDLSDDLQEEIIRRTEHEGL